MTWYSSKLTSSLCWCSGWADITITINYYDANAALASLVSFGVEPLSGQKTRHGWIKLLPKQINGFLRSPAFLTLYAQHFSFQPCNEGSFNGFDPPTDIMGKKQQTIFVLQAKMKEFPVHGEVTSGDVSQRLRTQQQDTPPRGTTRPLTQTNAGCRRNKWGKQIKEIDFNKLSS